MNHHFEFNFSTFYAQFINIHNQQVTSQPVSVVNGINTNINHWSHCLNHHLLGRVQLIRHFFVLLKFNCVLSSPDNYISILFLRPDLCLLTRYVYLRSDVLLDGGELFETAYKTLEIGNPCSRDEQVHFDIVFFKLSK